MHSADECAGAASDHAEPQPAILLLTRAFDGHYLFSFRPLESQHPAVSFIVGDGCGKIIERPFRCLDDVASDERRALSRALLAVLQTALPFKNSPTGKIILSELGKDRSEVN